FADVMMRKGSYPAQISYPHTLGFEVSGIVTAHGQGISEPALGTPVVALLSHGGYAEYVTAPAASVTPIPAGLDLAKATAALVQGLTAYGLIEIADVQADQAVLVQAAAGGVGTLAVQLAKQERASPVIGLASQGKLDLIRSLGADAALDYTQPDWTDRVLEANGGQRVDLVLEAVGGATGKKSLELVNQGGLVMIYGMASGEPFELNTLDLIMRGVTITPYSLSLGSNSDYVRRVLPKLLALLAKGAITTELQVFGLDQAAEAHAALENRQTRGKVVLGM
ncbi:MAG: zinc-binding dehydrogenase, partial [Deinococcota bacterium]